MIKANWESEVLRMTPKQHQLKIARQTLKMSPVMVKIMGGMTIEEAKQVIAEYEKEKKKRGK